MSIDPTTTGTRSGLKCSKISKESISLNEDLFARFMNEQSFKKWLLKGLARKSIHGCQKPCLTSPDNAPASQHMEVL